MMQYDFDIDFVVTWVDGSDPVWIEEYNKYVSDDKKIDASIIRYRDTGLLKYWFRCIETNAPWVRKVHFVTFGHIPQWLNVNCPKLHIVKHSDYIPQKYLPTFNSHTIENVMHLIPGLSEHFIYFNDDFFVVNKISPSDYFTKSGVIKDTAQLYPLPMSKWGNVILNNEIMVREKCDFKKCVTSNIGKWFNIKYGLNNLTTFILFNCINSACIRWSHFAQPYTKTLLSECYELFKPDIESTMSCKFRAFSNVSHFSYRNWYILRGEFEPKNIFRENLNMSIKRIIPKNILSKRYKVICIFDADIPNADDAYNELKDVFNQKFPDKSIFEY